MPITDLKAAIKALEDDINSKFDPPTHYGQTLYLNWDNDGRQTPIVCVGASGRWIIMVDHDAR